MITLARLKTILLPFEHRGARARPHGIVTRVLHWLVGALLIYGLLFPADIQDLADPVALAREVRFALVLGGLFVLRLIWIDLFGGGSRLPQDSPGWERILSRVVHYGIYTLVLAVVLSGLAIAFTASPAPTLFGLSITFLSGSPSQEFLLELHETFAGGLVLLILMHLLGATWHWIVRKDGVWQSMLWGRPRPVESGMASAGTVPRSTGAGESRA